MEEETLSQIRQKFLYKFQKEIVPKLNLYETERKKKLGSLIILFAVFIIIYFLYLLICHLCNYSNERLNTGLLYLALMIPCIHASFEQKAFEKEIKKVIMTDVCKCFGNIEWTAEQCINGKLFYAAGLLPTYIKERYDDIFFGSFRDLKIEIAEAIYLGIYLSEYTSFKGVTIKIEMNKKFNGHTLIIPRLTLPPTLKLKRTVLEDVSFEKEYNVFTSDEVEARYLITPTFMERIKKIETTFDSTISGLAFYENYLMITLGTSTKTDLFSIGALTKPLYDQKQFFKLYDEMESIFGLIDHLKLNQKIGL